MLKPNILQAGIDAVKRNWLPGLLLQAAMLAVLILYFFNPFTRRFLNHVAIWKLQGGYVFSFVATGIASGFFPEILKVFCFQSGEIRRENVSNSAFAFFYWGGIGALTDCFYHWQSFWFGDASDVSTVALKASVDMFLYTALFTCPLAISIYWWRARGFNRSDLWRIFQWNFLNSNIIPGVVACWMVWIPAVCVIYAMPGPLQIPVYVGAQAFWILVLTTMSEWQARRNLLDNRVATI